MSVWHSSGTTHRVVIEAPEKRSSSFPQLPITYNHTGRYVAAAEFVIIVLLAIVSCPIYRLIAGVAPANADTFLCLAASAAVFYLLCMQSQRQFRPSIILHPQGSLKTVVVTWLFAYSMILAFALMAKAALTFPRSMTIGFVITSGGALFVNRLCVRRLVAWGINNNIFASRRNVVIFGSKDLVISRGIGENLRRHGYKVRAQFFISADEGNSVTALRDIAAAFHSLEDFVQTAPVDEIFLVFGSHQQRLIDIIVDRLGALPIPAHLLLDERLGHLLHQPVTDLGASKAVRVRRGPLLPFQLAMKRTFDLVVASCALIVFAPLMLGVAVAIKLDSPGPVIFRQRRAGFSGRTFYIYKFRSMTTMDDGDIVTQARRVDPRVTRVGRYIRKTSIDELPQLINVLRGEMSVVGPRPHALSHDQQYKKLISTYGLRYHMKPGITGWAQVNGCRGETVRLESMAERVKHDIWYIVHWNLLLDVRAIILTALQVIRPRNVY